MIDGVMLTIQRGSGNDNDCGELRSRKKTLKVNAAVWHKILILFANIIFVGIAHTREPEKNLGCDGL